MQDNRGYIKYHDKKSSDFGIWVNLDNVHAHANSNITLTSIPGRSGDLLQTNNGSLTNVQMQIKVDVELPPRFKDFSDLEDAINDWLEGDNYDYLGFSWKPNYVYKAVVVTFPQFSVNMDIVPEQETATLTFECEPYKYESSSVEWQSLPPSHKVNNDRKTIARPDWHIVGSGDFILTVAGFPYLLNGIDGDIWIDGDTDQAYSSDGTDLNDSVQLANNTSPTLISGMNDVILEPQSGATLTKAEWRPKWRRRV